MAKENEGAMQGYSSYEPNIRTKLDDCARVVVRSIANYGANYFLNPTGKSTSGTYPYSQYIHNTVPVIENGFLKYKITMLIKGSYKINFGKQVNITGTFSTSMTDLPVHSLMIDGHVKILKNEIVSEIHYVWEGKSFLKTYKYINTDTIRVPKQPRGAPLPPPSTTSNTSYR